MQALWKERIEEATRLPPPRALYLSEQLRRAAASTAPPVVHGSPLWQAVSERDAERTITSFLEDRSKYYRGSISAPLKAMQYGSRLSVHLAWGTISLREVYQRVKERLRDLEVKGHPETARWRMSLGSFISRLHWRDHFIQRLESEPELEFRALHPAFRDLVWENSPELLDAWVNGRTGFPLVDAVMRCLAATGFINFRMRALVVSFACHALHLDWRLIHPHLARIFRDYEPGIHLSQLQMQAGVVGLNTIRIYNPQKQLLEQDPACRFVKRWLPELRSLSKEKIQMLVEAPQATDSPPPIVDWAQRSRVMREILYALRKSPEAVTATEQVFHRHGSRLRRSKRGPWRAPQGQKQLTLFGDSA
jgi:deoxyribodipyrimidine photo-lyase